MKKILSLAVLFAGISFATIAQESPKSATTKEIKESRQSHGKGSKGKQDMSNKTPEEIAKMRMEHLDKKVQLTDKQKKEVYAVFVEDAKSMVNNKSAQIDKKEDRIKHRQASMDRINKILTPEQQKLVNDSKKKSQGDKSKNKQDHSGHKMSDKSITNQ